MFRRNRPPEDAPPPRPPIRINGLILVIVLVFLAFLALALALNEGLVPDPFDKLWPLLVTVPAILWLIVALIRRRVRGVFSAAALFGLSISMLFAVQGIPLGSTLVGILFICGGIAILLRGLLLRNLPILD